MEELAVPAPHHVTQRELTESWWFCPYMHSLVDKDPEASNCHRLQETEHGRVPRSAFVPFTPGLTRCMATGLWRDSFFKS